MVGILINWNVSWRELLCDLCLKQKNKNYSILVYCHLGLGRTFRVKPLTYGHGPNSQSPGIWVMTKHIKID